MGMGEAGAKDLPGISFTRLPVSPTVPIRFGTKAHRDAPTKMDFLFLPSFPKCMNQAISVVPPGDLDSNPSRRFHPKDDENISIRKSSLSANSLHA